MVWMIASIMEIAVTVYRLTVCGSVNGVVVNFYLHIQKGNEVEASYVKVILWWVLLALSRKCMNLSMPCYHIMKISSMYL